MSVIPTCYVGVDVAQDSLVVCGPAAATVVTMPNTPKALQGWLGQLPENTHLVCEATGRHHYALQVACSQRALPLSCLNPARARDFARSLGKLEKTDSVDAAMLRRFGVERQPPATPVPSPAQRELRDLLMVRHALVLAISAHRQRLRLLTPEAARELRAIIRTLRTRLESLERCLESWLERPAAEPWRDKVYTLCLTVGVHVRSALALIGHLPELGSCNRRQIAKLVGLAPLPWDSGQSQGLRHIKGGRAPARQVLYQCAVVAIRWDLPTRTHYRQLRARGKPAKVALVAIARKLAIHLNSLLRPDQTGAA